MAGITNNTDLVSQNREVKSKQGNGFSVDDFFKLFASQLQNQDMMNPVDDNQFLAQMSQITTLQTMQQMNELTMTSYAFEFMGKNVVVADIDELGNKKEISGMVDKVTLYDGKPKVFVKGKGYDAAQVMEIATPAVEEKPETDPDEKPEETPVA